ncbi:Hydrolase (HAD superfamily) [Alkalibacterium sp. AK22]|nr:Hydrolase (HAD superfamily) [Alkalibacterium sp. AK22]
MYPNIRDIGCDGYIGGNGSYIESQRKIIFEQTLSLADCTRLVDWLQSQSIAFYLESNNGLYASKIFEEGARLAINIYAARKTSSPIETVTARDAFPNMKFGYSLYREQVNKISFLLKEYNDILRAETAFPEFKFETWGGAGETALFGDITLKISDKQTGITLLLEYLGASQNLTIVFGDAIVDLPMFACCHINVAMGKGGPEIKQAADYVTDSVEEDGLHNAFKFLKLI